MAVWIVLPILTLLMFDLGLTLRFEDFGKVFMRPWPIVVALTALSSVITLFTIPVIMSAAASIVGESVGISLPVGNLIKQNLLLMLLPVLLGIGIHYLWPVAAEKTDKVLGKLAFPLLLLLITVFYVQHHRTILDNIGVLGLCVTLLILAAVCCSSLLSRLVKTDSRQRRTVVIEVGMQNAAQAIAIASSPFIFANEELYKKCKYGFTLLKPPRIHSLAPLLRISAEPPGKRYAKTAIAFVN